MDQPPRPWPRSLWPAYRRLGSAVSEATPPPSDPGRKGHGIVPWDRIHIPIGVWIVLIGAILAPLVSGAMTWAGVRQHVQNQYIHVDQGEAVKGAGIAYKNDVKAAEDRATERVQAATKDAVAGLRFNCKALRGGGVDCRARANGGE